MEDTNSAEILKEDKSENGFIAENNEIISDCPELKTLKYKSMLLNGNTINQEIKSSNSFSQLQVFLEKEKNKNKQETWSKLSHSIKNKKISDFVKTYSETNQLSESEVSTLTSFLSNSIQRGKLLKNKEVVYDKTKGIIKELPGLIHNRTTNHFTLKNLDQKHMTTIKNIPSFLNKS